MQTATIAGALVLEVFWYGICCDTVQAGAEERDKGRAGLDELSGEMSTCAAYFSLLSSIIDNSDRPSKQKGAAGRMKATGQVMLVQAINVATYIGLDEKVPMERVQAALKAMVETINRDPAKSRGAMHGSYGVRCDALLHNGPQRFIALLKLYHAD
jgi:hypothetical protein